ncbi:D-alanyl-D-alanine carboxypeptidase family protein [Altererythrobacter sp. ZODW24]|uniref:D-alanyl-D-alanine carboxypeptidase family protein n=1 Tax=Altererythrobacter sp. ZODW24 TaxID=2185142 RepID=UPI001F07D8E5|nr:D-alanyl-D-alanine carboxypeptidase family protein [Altererythrobacter sp. ZODW24]
MSKFVRLILALTALSSWTSASGQELANSGPPTEAEAPIALMIDLSSGQTLFARDYDRRFIPASITKVMTSYQAFEMLADGRLSANQNFGVPDDIFEKWNGKGSTMFLQRGESVSVDNLLRGITTVSANDGSMVLATGASGSAENWVATMNQTARDLGMADSHFGTANGWPDEGRTYVTARDLTKLARALVRRHPELFKRYFGKEGFAYNGIAQANHDPVVGRVDGADGIKTGFTNQAGYGFLGTGVRDGRRVVMVVAGSSSESIRDRTSRRFLEWGLSGFESRRIIRKGDLLTQADVRDGDVRRVSLIAPRDLYLTVPKGEDPDVQLTVRFRGPIQAPFDADDAVARLEIVVDGLPDSSVPLVADRAVDRANLIERLFNGVAGLFS